MNQLLQNCGMLLLAALLVVPVCGCSNGNTGEPTASVPSEDDAAHHDEDEHLEHHIPEHRPPDFSSAVDQIASRFAALEELETGDLSETPLHELEDIVRWLPEIAADSDMRREHWEQVDRLAEELAGVLDGWRQLPSARADAQPVVERAVAALTGLKGTERDRTLQENRDG